MTTQIILEPEQLNALWQTDDGLSVALLLDQLTDAEKDALAEAYTHWLRETTRTRVTLAQVRRSFVEVSWKLERDDLDFTAASQRVRSLVETAGCPSRQAMDGFVYLLHFDRPISDRHTTQHYLGYADDWQARLVDHRAGRGARLTQVAVERGIGFNVVQVWPGTRDFERYLKRRKEGRRLCPICGQHHPKGRVVVGTRAVQLALDSDDVWSLPTQRSAAEVDAYRAFRGNRRTSFTLGDTSGIIPF